MKKEGNNFAFIDNGVLQQFVDWTKRKIRHHFDESKTKEIFFREKEIWWTALGKNIGYEMDGKHELFERPVLILKKYTKGMCFILPLTTQIKNPEEWYQYVIDLEGTLSAITLSQGKTISSKRLLRKIMTVDVATYNSVISQFCTQFLQK